MTVRQKDRKFNHRCISDMICFSLQKERRQKDKRTEQHNNITERQRDRKTERQKDRKTERQKDRKTERQKGRKTERLKN